MERIWSKRNVIPAGISIMMKNSMSISAKWIWMRMSIIAYFPNPAADAHFTVREMIIH